MKKRLLTPFLFPDILKISKFIPIATAVVVVLVVIGFASWRSNDPPLASQPHLDDAGEVHDWFEEPTADNYLSTETSRNYFIDHAHDVAVDAWREHGIESDAAQAAGEVLRKVLRFGLFQDLSALFHYFDDSGLEPSSASLERLNRYSKRAVKEGITTQSLWDGMSHRDRLALAINNHRGYALYVDAVGMQVLAGVGEDYLKTITEGFGVKSITGSHQPPAYINRGSPSSLTETRMAAVAFPVNREGFGEAWIEITLFESVFDQKWFVGEVSLWIPPSNAGKPSFSFFQAL